MAEFSKEAKKSCLAAFLVLSVFAGMVYSGQPLKVFILAGQSNMEGQGEMYGTSPGHLEQVVANYPAAYGHLKDGGEWAVRDDVWISYKRLNASAAKQGGLTAGYGANDHTIGPELQFGNSIGDFYDAPVLIIKTAWGGKSLYVDFRPPSSGWPETPTADGDMGDYYQEMMNTIEAFKADPQSFCSAYNAADGYEIVGFGWHQGWNDYVNSVFTAAYEANMVNFIKDVRKDLGIANLPFVIATSGMVGGTPYKPLELAQLAIGDHTKYPEFTGNTFVDDTRPYWRSVAESPADQGYHWNRNAETYLLIGKGMAEGMEELLVDPDAPVIDAGADMVTWSGETVYLNPVITESSGSDWTNLTYKWTAIPDTGVVISDDEIVNPSITITKSAGDAITVVMKLEVNNSGRTEPGVENAVLIDVYDTGCKAAIGEGEAVGNPTDLNGDCITNFEDLVVFASDWLDGEVLSGPVQK